MDIRDIEPLPHQLSYLQCELNLVFFGGGAGGGKTFASLLDNVQGIHDPDYVSAFFRTTTTEIEKGLWLEAKKLYHSLLFDKNDKPKGKAHINERQKCITFPSGAKTFFGYLEHDKNADAWYGQELAKIYFEELQFRSWYQFNVLRSRNRSMARVIKGVRCTLNPDPNHFVYKFVERFLDEEKYPVKELSGRVAYYLIVNDVLYTSWDRQELVDMFPPDSRGRLKRPLTYTYIPATLEDNTMLLERDPDYLATLESMPEIKRKQLQEGCWESTDNSGMYFKREWLQELPKVPLGLKLVRPYDLAFSEKTATTDPDFTASVGVGKCSQGYYYLIGNYVDAFTESDNVLGRMRKRSGERDKIILDQAKHDGRDCHIILPEDAGAAGKDSFVEKVKFFTSHGFIVKRDPASHTANKLSKFEPFATAAEHGLVYIVKSTFNDATYEAIMRELETFDGITKSGRRRKDDWVDAVATGFNHQAKTVVLPKFSLPDMSRANPLKH